MVFRGEAIELHTLGRSNLLKAKVFALCDRGFDLPDCVALNPMPANWPSCCRGSKSATCTPAGQTTFVPRSPTSEGGSVMGYSRAVAPTSAPEADALTEDMAGIGTNLGGRANHRANIENTLFFAWEEGMDRADLRVLSVLVAWLGVHGARVNVDRLARLVKASGSKRVRAFWTAVGRWLAKDGRYVPPHSPPQGRARQSARCGDRLPDPTSRGKSPVRRKRPARTGKRPAGSAGRRHDCRGTRTQAPRLLLARRHRPDLPGGHVGGDRGTPSLKAAGIARRTYGSFATAWQVKRDWEVWVSGRAS